MDSPQSDLDNRIRRYYAEQFDESVRLTSRSAAGQVEFIRTQEILRSRLPPSARIADIGGATGIHAEWLAQDGHRVDLLDPVPEQVAQAARIGTFTATVGDARRLPWTEDTFDAVLLFGPLYHLEAAADRERALAEAVRVTKPGGLVFVAAIPRLVAFASAFVGQPLTSPLSPALLTLLEDGRFQFSQIRFPGGHVHTAEELEGELDQAGLTEISVVGLEGLVGLGLEVRGTADANLVEEALTVSRQLGQLPFVRDFSNHLLGVGTVSSR